MSKKADPIERAKRVSAAVNKIKTVNTRISTEHLKTLLQDHECPYPTYIPMVLERRGIITRHKGICTFMSNEPIHYALLLDEVNNVAKDCAARAKGMKDGAAADANKEQQAIDYLKGLGTYRISKLVNEWQDC